MNPQPLPTVRIKADNDLGYVVINESDFQEGMILFDEIPPEKKSK